MNTVTRIAAAFAAGAAAMYYLDPLVGRRRRALVRDKGVAAGHDLGRLTREKARYAADRVHGMVAETRSTLAATPVGDLQLRDRIRTRLGRLVDDPGAVGVEVQDGQVVLRGTASADEIEDVLETVAAMRGVAGIDSHLVTADGFRQFEAAVESHQRVS